MDLESAVISLETDIQAVLKESTTERIVRRVADLTHELFLTLQVLIRERRAARRRETSRAHTQDKRVLNQLNQRMKAALDERYQNQ